MSPDEIGEVAEQKQRELDKLCHIEDGWIRFPAWKYDIELSRIASYKKLVWWTNHLAGKPWMTLPLLRHAMRLVCKHHKKEYRGTL